MVCTLHPLYPAEIFYVYCLLCFVYPIVYRLYRSSGKENIKGCG